MELDPAAAPVALFIHATLARDPLARTPIAAIHAAHITWAQERGYTPLSIVRLGKYIKAPRRKANGIAYVLGIRLI